MQHSFFLWASNHLRVSQGLEFSNSFLSKPSHDPLPVSPKWGCSGKCSLNALAAPSSMEDVASASAVVCYHVACLLPLPNNYPFPRALPWQVGDVAIFLLSFQGSQAPSSLGVAHSTRFEPVLSAHVPCCPNNARAACKKMHEPCVGETASTWFCRWSNRRFLGREGGREAGGAPEHRSLDCVCILSSYWTKDSNGSWHRSQCTGPPFAKS